MSLDENKKKWLDEIEKDSLNWYHVNDLRGQGNNAAMLYRVEGIPDSFLIDDSGTIITRFAKKRIGQKIRRTIELMSFDKTIYKIAI